ncbi:nucleoside-triphosphatase [Faecalimonas sp.]
MKNNYHIFLTGEKNVGKSTIIEKVVKENNLHLVGFKTLPYYEEGRFTGYIMKEVGMVQNFSMQNRISTVLENDKVFPIIETFENIGVTIISKSMKKSKWILMDELGRFETKAPNFRRAVMECLDGACCVIGVIQDVETDFLDEIRNRKDIVLIKVTEENRNELPLKISRYIRG